MYTVPLLHYMPLKQPGSQAIRLTGVNGASSAAAATAGFAAAQSAVTCTTYAALLHTAAVAAAAAATLLLLLTCVGKSRPRHEEAAATDPPDTPPIGVTPGVTTPTFCSAYSTPKYLSVHVQKAEIKVSLAACDILHLILSNA
jgi:hypothetical protein